MPSTVVTWHPSAAKIGIKQALTEKCLGKTPSRLFVRQKASQTLEQTPKKNSLDTILTLLGKHDSTSSATTFRAAKLGSSQQHHVTEKGKQRLVGPSLGGQLFWYTFSIDVENRGGTVT